MSYFNRFKFLFHSPADSIQDILSNPSFIKTSIILCISSIVFTSIAELGLFACIMPHFVAAYSLMFTVIWFIPSVITMLLLKNHR